MSNEDYLTKRDGVWHFIRRVPVEYQQYDARNPIRLSTKIKVANDRKGAKALRVIAQMNIDVEAFWRGCANGKVKEAKQSYADAVRRARVLGFDYVQPEEGAVRPLRDVLNRIETLMQGNRGNDPVTTAAVLGGVAKPSIKLSNVFDEYEAATRSERVGYSPKQIRKWQNGKKRAMEMFIEHIGDKDINDLTRQDALRYRDWWQDRITDERIEIGTANKNITHIGGMFNSINELHRLRLDAIFSGTRLKRGKTNSRRPFDPDFVQKKLFADGALMGLNDDARRILFVVADTGARPSEIANLQPAQIILDADIPRIRVQPDGRVLKTDESEREIPLVGVALAALKEMPGGFARYQDNEDSLSACVNKYLRERGYLSDGQTFYSLRHTFKDRLKSVEAQEEMIDELMGHASKKPKYGDGYGLQLKHKLLQKIAFRPPAQV